jgi:hypothetical protein
MDVGKSFTYMFEDKDWITKIAIGGGILLVGGLILGWLIIPALAAAALLLGYTLGVIKNVYEGNPNPLPKWENIGELFMKGVTAFVGVLIWALPVIVLACCIAIAAVGFGAGMDSSNAENLSPLATLILSCLYCLTFVVGIAISLFVYAPLTNFAINNQLSTFWDFRGQWRFIQMNAGNYIIAFLLALVASFIAGFGIILCLIGVFFTNFWAMLVMGHLFGQVARANMAPTDSGMLPPAPPPVDEPPSMMQGPYEPAPSA